MSSPEINRNDILQLLNRLQGMIESERELLGEFLLYEKSRAVRQANAQVNNTSSTAPRHVAEPAPAGELLLFDMPAPSTPGRPTEPWEQAKSLDELNAMICNCTKCGLGFTRTKFVFGVGNPHATLMLIGEAPGADEDAQGEPFVGRAGQLL
ncbi:MAG TPA: uracil-DNA glycosylase family protein, partial [Bacteroidota bacterium]|nr:uracil-DNA glycosylase family protein [Bacteroidota bacterium]